MGRWRPAVASAAVYVTLVCVMARDVLGALGSRVLKDEGDPLLNAAILSWNARHVPLTQAWWNLPIFYPAPDTLAFSENLLGLSVLADPLHWLTGSALVTYNVVTLATFPLCALAMYALVYRFTASAPAAFLAGLMYGFAPYRMAHLAHVQVLAAFWMPLSLLGLHAYLDSRRLRWLALFAVGWMLQGLTNGYYLVFFSVLVGLWVAWFVVAAGKWRNLALIAASVALAAVPIALVFRHYAIVHARNGFVRELYEIQAFSADVTSVLCAPYPLLFWNWLRISCSAENELFPGLTVLVLAIAAAVFAVRQASGAMRWPDFQILRVSRAILSAIGVLYTAVACSVWVWGAWRFNLGSLRVSASSVTKPTSFALACLVAAMAMHPRFNGTIRRSPVIAFYLFAAVLTWLLCLGPTPTFMGTQIVSVAPYAWLMQVPGVGNLRVAARFWMMTLICLSVVCGIVLAAVQKSRMRGAVAVLVLAAAGLGIDMWAGRFEVADVPPPPPNAARLAGSLVLELPLGDPFRDAPAVFRAVTGRWTTVNGYSGYDPPHYEALKADQAAEDDSLLDALREFDDLEVIVHKGAPRLRALVERAPRITKAGETAERIHYHLPRAGEPLVDSPLGEKLPIQRLTVSCGHAAVKFLTDQDLATRWECGPQAPGQEVLIDLGRPATTAAVVHMLGPYSRDFPRHLVMDTSTDGAVWESAWNGNVFRRVILAGLTGAGMRVTLPFAPRRARYVRLQQLATSQWYWSIADLEVRAPATR